MKNRALFGLLVALALCGCQVKEDGEFASEGKVFTATMEAMVDDGAAIETKTSMDASGNVRWKRGDQVSIFVGSTINQHFQVTDESDGKTAASLNPVESSGFVAGGEISNNVAFYPYGATAEIAKNGNSYVISDVALPATQNYAESSFGNGAFPMTAVTSSIRDYNLKFKNVLGGLKLLLKGTAVITSISVTGNNNEKLCGTSEVTVSGTSAPSINLTNAAAKTVNLDCGEGVQLSAETARAFIIALPPMTMTGGFTVTVTDIQGKKMEIKTTKSQTITRSNLLSMPAVTYEGKSPDPVSVPVAVDLGLTSGLKWASFNVGASAPEEYGDYFAWGETSPKLDYSRSTYIWYNESTSTLTKYYTSGTYGIVDNKTVLDPDDDAANTVLEGSWRMPTREEWAELLRECTGTWTTVNGINGRLYTGPNNNSIFLPAAGCLYGTYLDGAGSNGNYWSSSLDTDSPGCAWRVRVGSSSVASTSDGRCYGRSVRAVSEGFSLNKRKIYLVEGGTASLNVTITPFNATQPTVIWSSNNTAVATVDYNGVVFAVSVGNATITATTYDGGFIATCAVKVSAVPEAVDLGLTSGLKWATHNIGANTPEEYGYYFAWGETAPKSDYSWPTYIWCNGTYGSQTKYCTNSSYGTVDNITVLDNEDDAASENLGGTWRMPTDADWTELRTECIWTWTTRNGVNGILITSNSNSNNIFLPYAGSRDNTYIINGGYYWSSSLFTDYPSKAWYMGFYSNEVYRSYGNRCNGHSVRPVTD